MLIYNEDNTYIKYLKFDYEVFDTDDITPA